MTTPELLGVCQGSLSEQTWTFATILAIAFCFGILAGVIIKMPRRERKSTFTKALEQRSERVHALAATFMGEGLNGTDALHTAERMVNKEGNDFVELYIKDPTRLIS